MNNPRFSRLLSITLLIVTCCGPLAADEVLDSWRRELDTHRMNTLERADWFERTVREGRGGANLAALKRFVEDPLRPRGFGERAPAALALGRFGIRDLRTGLDSPYPEVRWIAAAAVVGRFTETYFPGELTEHVAPERFTAHGHSVVDSVEAFLEGLQRDDLDERVLCLAVLRMYRPRGDPFFLQLRTGQLLEGLTDESPLVRYGAALGLRGHVFWRMQETVATELARAATDVDPRVRRAAVESLAHVGRRAWPVARTVILRSLADGDAATVAIAADALLYARSNGRDVTDSVGAVLTALDRAREPFARAALIRAGAVIGAEGDADAEAGSSERVCSALGDTSAIVRLEAAHYAQRFRRRPIPVAAALLTCASDTEAPVRAAVLHSLRGLRVAALPIAEAAIRGARDPSPRVRSAATWLMLELAPRDRGCVARLMRPLLRDPCWLVRESAVTVVGKLGPEARPCLPELIALLDHDHVRSAARRLIRRLGAEAVPYLAERIHPAAPVRRADLTDLLGSIGAPAIPALKDLLESDREAMRAAGIAGLARMGSAARKSAEAELIHAASREKGSTAALAGWALYRVGRRVSPSKALRAAATEHRWCAWAMAQIARDTPGAFHQFGDDLARLRGHADPAIGDAAADALASLEILPPSETDRFAGPALPRVALLAYLKTTRDGRRRVAVARTLRARAIRDGESAGAVVKDVYGVMTEAPRADRGWLSFPEVAGSAMPLGHPRIRRAAECRILAALALYPPDLIRARLRRVVLVASLTVSGAQYGGTYHGRTIYLAVGDRAGLDLERMFHHELSSLLFAGDSFPREAWRRTLPELRTYGRGGRQAIHAGRTGGVAADLFRDGFFKPYATSDLENDFNVFSELAMTYPGWARAVAANHPRLAAKWRIWREYLRSLDANFELPPAPR